MRSCTVLLMGFVLSVFSAQAEIDVKDTQGRSMKIEVLSYTKSSGNVRIKRLPDEAIFNVKLALFDSASQKKIVEAAPKARAKILAKVSAGKRRKKVPGSSFMETQTITARVGVENDSRDVDFHKGKGTILLVARQTRRFADRDQDYGKILAREEFPISLDAGGTTNFECKPVVTEYDKDRDETNIGGWTYYGWMLIIQNGEGEIHQIETSIGNLKREVDSRPKLGARFLTLKVDQMVETNLEEKE